MKKLVLASSSPARKAILDSLGIKYSIDAGDYEEDMSLDMKPGELAMYLSKGKARSVVGRHKDSIILAADSFASFKGHLMGKPHTHNKAKEMLAALSGKSHSFITGFTIIDADTNKEYSEFVETKIKFTELTDEDIENYLENEDVLKNAGAYIIQGLGATLIEEIEGDYSNIAGLPVFRVFKAMRNFGFYVLSAEAMKK